MSESIRSFIAFDLDNEQVLKKIADFQFLLVETGADLKPVEPRNIHLTIRFLGNIRPSMINEVCEKMKQVQFTSFNVKLCGIGAFPTPRYPRVVWVGITEGSNQLRGIFEQLEPELRGLGFAPDSKGFNPHLTIARVRSARNKEKLCDFITKHTGDEFGMVRAEFLRLKRSELTPRGPIYSTLGEFEAQE